MGMDNMAPMNGLRAFDAVARHLSFSLAANELCVTQGAISRQISNLENILGVTLFLRTNRQVRLTTKGVQLFASIGEPFHQIREGVKTLTSNTDDLVLKVNVPPTLGIRWLVPRLANFHGVHPQIDVQLTTSHKIVDFKTEDVDVAIYWGDGNWEGLKVDLLMGETLIPVCSPQLMKEKPITTADDFNDHVLLHSMNRTDDWLIWQQALGIDNIKWQQVLKFENSALTYQAAIDQLGVVIAQHVFVEEDLAAGRLVAPFPELVPGERAYYLVYPAKQRNQKKVAIFRSWLLEMISSENEARAN